MGCSEYSKAAAPAIQLHALLDSVSGQVAIPLVVAGHVLRPIHEHAAERPVARFALEPLGEDCSAPLRLLLQRGTEARHARHATAGTVGLLCSALLCPAVLKVRYSYYGDCMVKTSTMCGRVDGSRGWVMESGACATTASFANLAVAITIDEKCS
jgi:hypothetical protein